MLEELEDRREGMTSQRSVTAASVCHLQFRKSKKKKEKLLLVALSLLLSGPSWQKTRSLTLPSATAASPSMAAPTLQKRNQVYRNKASSELLPGSPLGGI